MERWFPSPGRQQDDDASPESPGGPLEVRAFFLQVLVVRVDSHKLWKAEGIHGCLHGETTGEKYNNLLYLALPFFKSSSMSVGNALFLHLLSPTHPLLITNIVWTSVEFRCATFALLLKIKHAES